MKRFILILTVALLMATMIVPAALAGTSTAPAGISPARSQTLMCAMRICPDSVTAKCYCSGPRPPYLTR